MSQEKAAEIIDLNASREAGKAQSRIEKAGEFLANARNAAGLDLEAVGKATKVKIEHLAAIEETRPDRLPALPYAVGFVKVYAQYLDLDADAVAAQFKEDVGAAVAAPVELAPKPVTPAPAPESGEGAKMASVFGILAIILFAGWVAFTIMGNTRTVDDAPAVTPQSEDATINDLAAVTAVETPAAAPVSEDAQSVSENSAGEDAVAATADDAIAAPSLVDGELAPGEVPDTAPATPQSTSEATPEATAPRETAAPPAAPVRARVRAPRQTKPVVVAAALTRSIAPDYPERCADGASPMEAVTLLFDVTETGRTTNARVVSSTNTCFERSALRTINRWRFSPKTVDGAAQVDAGKAATLHFRQ